MGKRGPSNQTWKIKPNQTVDNYHGLSSLFSKRRFNFGTHTTRQFPLKKFVDLQKTSAKPNSQDITKDPLSGEVALVHNGSKNTVPPINSQARDLQNGDFTQREQSMPTTENTTEEFTS